MHETTSNGGHPYPVVWGHYSIVGGHPPAPRPLAESEDWRDKRWLQTLAERAEARQVVGGEAGALAVEAAGAEPPAPMPVPVPAAVVT